MGLFLVPGYQATVKSQYWCLIKINLPRWHLGSRFTKTLDSTSMESDISDLFPKPLQGHFDKPLTDILLQRRWT